jgi:hypothetical protein
MTVAEDDTAATTPTSPIDVDDDDDADAGWPQLPPLELEVCLAAEDTHPGLPAGTRAIRTT